MLYNICIDFSKLILFPKSCLFIYYFLHFFLPFFPFFLKIVYAISLLIFSVRQDIIYNY